MYLLKVSSISTFVKVKSHQRKGKKGTFLVKEFDRKERKKRLVENVIKASIVTGLIGAVALTHPAIRTKISAKKIDLNLEDALYELDLNPGNKKVISTFRTKVKSFIPTKTNSSNYNIDLDENKLKTDLTKWRKELDNIPANTRQNKYDIQKDMFDQVLQMDWNKAPDVFPVGYRDKAGTLKGFSILRPNLEYDSLEIANFAIKDKENKLLRDLLRTNIYISNKLGFKGKIYGSDASTYAEKIYVRLGAKKMIDDGYLYTPKNATT